MIAQILIALATTTFSATIPKANTKSGAVFLDCTAKGSNQKTSQIWILKDLKDRDIKKAGIAIASTSKHLTYESNYNFGEMPLMFGSNLLEPIQMIPDGVFKVEYASESSAPVLLVDTEVGIQETPFVFASSPSGAVTWPNPLPGLTCTVVAMAEFDVQWKPRKDLCQSASQCASWTKLM